MKRSMLVLAALVFSAALAILAFSAGAVAVEPGADDSAYLKLKEDAERFFEEGSYARALELYRAAKEMSLPPTEARWVEFRLADAAWRSELATQKADSSELEKQIAALEKIVQTLARTLEHTEERDRVWAEAAESLADASWITPRRRNWGAAWPRYEQALDWWAGSSEVAAARERYLRIIQKAARPPGREPYYYYGYYGNQLPVPVIENALRIAVRDDDKAFLNYLLAMTLRYQGGDGFAAARAIQAFETSIAIGKTEWYDDALFNFAEWMSTQGRPEYLEDGTYRTRPDFKEALRLYRRILSEFQKGETRHYDNARARAEQITRAEVSVAVSEFYEPGAIPEYHAGWRNVPRVDFSVYPIGLTKDVDLSGDSKTVGSWLASLQLAGREAVLQWSKETGDRGDYQPGSINERLTEKLPPGAYVIEARGEGQRARDIILVTDTALVLKTSARKALVFVAKVGNGEPIGSASVLLWERYHDGKNWRWARKVQETDKDGIATFALEGMKNSSELFASAVAGDRQCFATAGAYGLSRREGQWMSIYAFTDRPAYRPGEPVEWKVIARRTDGEAYSTPAGESIEYEVTDPRGTKAASGTLALGEFGSAAATVQLDANAPLGEYHVTFFDAGRKNGIGSAVLFRLEEYKLPEFKVAVRVPEENGKRKRYRLGERVEATIAAEYYFGGPVAGAEIEVVVRQFPYYYFWMPERNYPWLYEGVDARLTQRRWGGGQVVKQEKLRTDSTGKAIVTIDTPLGQTQDLEYTIEARVTDSSRREIRGTASIRVTRQRYSVSLRPEHSIYRLGDRVKVLGKAVDANREPVEVEGTVVITRDRWTEIWLDPNGAEVKGEALEKLRRKGAFPPIAELGWKLKFRGYEHEEVLRQQAHSNSRGDIEVAFQAAKEGYYTLQWSSPDPGGPPVRGSASLWVATPESRDLGFHSGGLQLIADGDTFHVGKTSPVMIAVPSPGAWVLFTIEGEGIYEHRLLHVDGSVRLTELDVLEKHVPNIVLSAAMVWQRELLVDEKAVVVPPERQFLNVEVAAEKAELAPRAETTLKVTTKDYEGKPVSAEVALSVVDEAIYYIQEEYARDPRQFFYGEERGHAVQTASTFQQKRFARPQTGRDGVVVDASGRRDEVESQENEEALSDKLALKDEGRAGGRMQMAQRARGMSAMKRFGAAPAAPAAAAELSVLEKSKDSDDESDAGAGEDAVQVRSDFRSTVLWQPAVRTGPDGTASVPVRFPDSLTTWRASARAATRESRFGIATSTVRTVQPLIARLQAPRFFVAGDRTVVSAVINNNTDRQLRVSALLEAQGIRLSGLVKDGKLVAGDSAPIEIEAHGEARVDWVVEADGSGNALLRVTAKGDGHADAMERTYPILEHGLEKLLAKSGKLRGGEAVVRLDLPPRKPGSTSLIVQVAPSIAVTMLDALPYLADYPYGCTEQTLSRFLPAVITARTLRELKLDPREAMARRFGGVETGTAEKTHPGGKKDLTQLDAMAEQGLRRLEDFQHADGGWAWWREGDSDHFMTAYVLWGLSLARAADLDVSPARLDRARDYLEKEIVEAEDEPDLQAWMLHALAVHRALTGAKPSDFVQKASDNLWKKRDGLNAYSRALFALAAHHLGDADRAKALVRNLENGVKRDDKPDTSVLLPGGGSQAEVMATAHWGEDGLYWRWSDGGVEATAFALRAFLAIDPENRLVEPVMNWLVKNRRGAQWSNTRDTAITVLALGEYLRRSGEVSADLAYEVIVNGSSVASRQLTAADALGAPSRFSVDVKLLKDAGNEVHIVRKGGKGPIYFAVEARFFSLEEPVTPAGNELFITRAYRKLVPRPTLLKGFVEERFQLADQGVVTSGERVEVLLTIEAKNNYEYVMIEDFKPAGLEAVEVRSGQSVLARELKSRAVERKAPGAGAAPARRIEDLAPIPSDEEAADYTGRMRGVYQELRDSKVALFLDRLPEGVWEIRYELRAEAPGKFHGLPPIAQAMYVPELRANGAEVRLEVLDKEPDLRDKIRRALVEAR